MEQSGRLIWDLPGRPRRSLPYRGRLCAPSGAVLYNGSMQVIDEADPSLFYKFVSWDRSALAVNELDICSTLPGLEDGSHIVRLVGVGGTDEHLVRVYERSTKGSVAKVLFERAQGDHRRTDTDLVRRLLAEIAEAMSRIHDRDVVHRDLKAENILTFDDDGGPFGVRAKIADFDRAIELRRGERLKEPVGSLLHMAPELFLQERYDRKIDVYAFGVVMFELAHGGRRAHSHVASMMPESISKAEFVRQVVEDELRPNWLHADQRLKELAARCWSTDPDLRPEFEEIAEVLNGGGGPVHPSRREGGPRRRPPELAAIDGVGIASDIGLGRNSMEDAACVLSAPDRLIAAVFDGLSGSRASEFSARRLVLALAEQLREDDDPDAAIKAAFASMEEALGRARPPIEAGSTAVVAMLQGDDLILSWIGDSPACLFRRGASGEGFETVELVDRHRPGRADEAARVAANGGAVRQRENVLDSGEVVPWGAPRVFTRHTGADRGVAITRALGLFAFKPAVGNEAEITRLARRSDDLFLVLGSDGVFDVLTADAIFEITAAAGSPQLAADAIIAAVLDKGAPDNATVLVIDMASRPSRRGLAPTS